MRRCVRRMCGHAPSCSTGLPVIRHESLGDAIRVCEQNDAVVKIIVAIVGSHDLYICLKTYDVVKIIVAKCISHNVKTYICVFSRE